MNACWGAERFGTNDVLMEIKEGPGVLISSTDHMIDMAEFAGATCTSHEGCVSTCAPAWSSPSRIRSRERSLKQIWSSVSRTMRQAILLILRVTSTEAKGRSIATDTDTFTLRFPSASSPSTSSIRTRMRSVGLYLFQKSGNKRLPATHMRTQETSPSTCLSFRKGTAMS